MSSSVFDIAMLPRLPSEKDNPVPFYHRPVTPPLAAAGIRDPNDTHEMQDIVTDLPTTPRRRIARRMEDDAHSMHPPSFAQSEFDTIVRRQRNNRPHNIKAPPNIRTRYPNLDNDWEFAGWGTMSYLELVTTDLIAASERMDDKDSPKMGQFMASAIAGNDIIGSVFYAFPAVASACGIYAPIALLFSSVLLLLFRPILLELASAMRLNGGNYTYLLQSSGKPLAAVGAAATLLDAVSTSTVSAATAGAYLVGELSNTIGSPNVWETVLGVGFLFIVGAIALLGLKESSGVALSMLIAHLVVMFVLMVASAVAWGRAGSEVLLQNWALRPEGLTYASRTIFNGVCIGFLGVTGFECTPTYVESVRPASFPLVLRNLIIAVTVLNAPLMLLVYAVLPQAIILNGANVLSVLAETVAGKWLRIIVVIDAIAILLGGVLAGVVMLCSLLERLAQDRVLPQIFLRRLPVTHSEYVAIGFSLILSLLLYASCGFNLSLISSMFAIAFLSLMALYPVSHFLMKFNRDRLPRKHRTSLLVSVLAFLCTIVLWVGNISQDPITIGLFAAYFSAILMCLFVIQSQVNIARVGLWLYDQANLSHWNWSKGLDGAVTRLMGRLRGRAICVWIKSDDIYSMVESILYVRKNEATARIIFIHAYESVDEIPSELEANSKLVDEAFPSITIDLVFVHGQFGPPLVEAVSSKLDVPRSCMFVSCFGRYHGFELADYRGVRVISL